MSAITLYQLKTITLYNQLKVRKICKIMEKRFVKQEGIYPAFHTCQPHTIYYGDPRSSYHERHTERKIKVLWYCEVLQRGGIYECR